MIQELVRDKLKSDTIIRKSSNGSYYVKNNKYNLKIRIADHKNSDLLEYDICFRIDDSIETEKDFNANEWENLTTRICRKIRKKESENKKLSVYNIDSIIRRAHKNKYG